MTLGGLAGQTQEMPRPRRQDAPVLTGKCSVAIERIRHQGPEMAAAAHQEIVQIAFILDFSVL